ncbi:MAG: cytochrome c [Marinoscillum sp.]
MSSEEQGAMIYTNICAKCHGEDGRKGLFDAADLSLGTLNTSEKIEVVTHGSPLTVMRSFKEELTEDQIIAVVNYVELVVETK